MEDKEGQEVNGMSEEYDLRKSEKIGQLYPVLVDKHGNVIDGFHRLEADPNWEKKRLEEIDTEEKLLIARTVSNWHRRQVPREEKEEWINGLARIYQKQGLKVGGRGRGHRNEIRERIEQVTGLKSTVVNSFLHAEFKGEALDFETEPRVPASQAIISTAKDKEYGKQLVERHREEVERELRPRIEREVEPRIREDLSRDVDFIREAIERAPAILPNLPKRTIERAKEAVKPKEMGVKEGIVYTVGEYECPHCKRHYLIKCDGKRDWVE